MAKPTITTRADKGSALTWTEGDSNLTNLRDATVTIKAGTGGTDVVSDLNGTVTLVAGTNITLAGDNSAKTVTINASGGGSSLPDQTGNTDKVLTTDGTNLSWTDTLTGKTLTKYKEQMYAGGSQSASYTPNWNNGPVHTVTLTGNVTFAAPTNMVAGASLTLILKQDGTGSRTGSWNASYKFLGGTPVLSTAAGSIDIVSVFYDGTNYISGLSTQSGLVNLTGLQITSAGEFRLADTDSSHYVGFKAPATVSANNIWTLPATDGTNGQVLSTNGSDVLSWVTPASGTIEAYFSATSIAAVYNGVGTYQNQTETWTQRINNGTGITIPSASAFSVPAGTWIVKFTYGGVYTTATSSVYSQYRIQNTTAGTTVGETWSLQYPNHDYSRTPQAVITLGSTSTIQIQGQYPSGPTIQMNLCLIQFIKVA